MGDRQQTPLFAVIGRYLKQRRTLDRLAPSTSTSYRATLMNFANIAGVSAAGELSRRHVIRYMEDKTAGGLSEGALSLYISRLRTFSAWCVEERYVRSDWMHGIHGPKRRGAVPRALPPSDVSAALEMARCQRDRTIVAFMVYAGMRVSEVRLLRRCDLDLDGRMLLVAHAKGGKQRELPIVDGLYDEIMRLFGERVPASTDYVIRSLHDDRSPLTRNTVSVLVSRLLYAAGVKLTPYDGRSAHAFRHATACDMLANGADIRDVRDALGHAHSSTTLDVYGNRLKAMGRLRDAMEGRTY